MNIAIRSEADSRVLVYPLIRSLYPYGTICVITNNIYMRRLLDTDTLEGGFRNVRVIVQPDGDLEEALEQEDMYKGKYDFVIYDNMGYPDFDVECIIITSRVSESYLQDIVWLVGEEGTKIFRFGAGAPRPKQPKEKKERPDKKRLRKGENSEDDIDLAPSPDDMSPDVLDATAAKKEDTGFNDDGTYKNKWTAEKTDAEILNDKLAEAQATVLPFPSFEDIEKMECRWILPKVESKLAKVIYQVIGPYINVEERLFMKGVSSQDEGGNFISGADVR